MSKSQRSVMSHKFSQVPAVTVPRSSFDRSHGLKTTFDAGLLIPIYVDEALPGDTFNLNMTGFARLATPIKPFMDNVFMETFFFFVPNRLIWDNWEKFNGAQDNPGDSTEYTVPNITLTSGAGYGGILDYMGVPPKVNGTVIDVLPVRAYNLIYNEWFRDQNLQDSVPLSTADAGDNTSDFVIRRRGKRHDYFTSALPWPQKGDPVTVNLGGFAPVVGITGQVPIWTDTTGIPSASLISDAGTGNVSHTDQTMAAANPFEWKQTALQTDLSSAAGITINQLREGFQIQRMFERDARGGTRYTEIIRAHFGVTSPDSRLQRPEYLGGGSSPVNINPIASTVPTDLGGATPQGNLAAMGTTVLKNHSFSKSFTEHGVIIGLVNVRADLTYQQGLNRMWSRKTRFDFYWPALSHLGEQEILNKEIFLGGTAAPADEQAFGYQERYAEYRYKPSQITGKMRSSDPQSLDVWHLSQDFSALPVLNGSFIEDNPPIERVIAVQDEPHFLFDAYFNLRCARPMPLYGVPGMIDHF